MIESERKPVPLSQRANHASIAIQISLWRQNRVEKRSQTIDKWNSKKHAHAHITPEKMNHPEMNLFSKWLINIFHSKFIISVWVSEWMWKNRMWLLLSAKRHIYRSQTSIVSMLNIMKFSNAVVIRGLRSFSSNGMTQKINKHLKCVCCICIHHQQQQQKKVFFCTWFSLLFRKWFFSLRRLLPLSSFVVFSK